MGIVDNSLNRGNAPEIAGWALASSNNYENLTLDRTGSTYTAPAAGWVVLAMKGSQGKQIKLTFENGLGVNIFNAQAGDAHIVGYVPILKGQTVTYTYGAQTLDVFRFVYAEGGV